MLFDLVSYSGWLIAASGIGLVVGWRTYLDAPRRNWRDGWIVWGALAFVIGVIVAALKLLPGRYGLWLEIALLMIAFYVVGCFLGGGLKKLLGAHESGGAAAADVRNSAKLEAERQATAKAAADRLAVEVAVKAEASRKEAARKEAARKEADRKAAAAKAEADRLAAEAAAKAEAERARAEIEQRAAAAAKAEAERLAAAILAKAEAERLAAAAVAKAVADRKVTALKAEADRLAAAAKAEAEGSAVKTEPDDPARGRPRQRDRLLPLPGRRRIVLWRKPPPWPRRTEKQVRPPKLRRVVWLQRV